MYKKYLLLRSRCVMPLDILFFAEGGGDGAGTDALFFHYSQQARLR